MVEGQFGTTSRVGEYAPPEPGSSSANRWAEIALAFLLIIALAPVIGLIALLIHVPGQPLIVRRRKVGCPIAVMLYEFNLEPHLVLDPGRQHSLLNYLWAFAFCSRADQIPQLVNVLKGELRLFPSRNQPYFLQA